MNARAPSAPAADPREAEQIAYWNDATAAHWTTLQARIDHVFSPITALAMEAASPRPGERALDIGSGCGATVLELARRVGPQGQVCGIDISVPMSACARERIAAAGLATADIVVGDAATHAFVAADRDLLFSRFGVMFFADPHAALANLLRATRGGGRLAWVAWRHLAENPWFAVPLQAALPLLPAAPPADPLAPGPFAFADADRVRHLLRTAGWQNVKLVRHDVPLRLAAADDVAGAADLVTCMGPLARRLARSNPNPALKTAVRASLEAALSTHVAAGGIVLTASTWIISAYA